MVFKCLLAFIPKFSRQTMILDAKIKIMSRTEAIEVLLAKGSHPYQ
jgi:hypothetical protein